MHEFPSFKKEHGHIYMVDITNRSTNSFRYLETGPDPVDLPNFAEKMKKIDDGNKYK